MPAEPIVPSPAAVARPAGVSVVVPAFNEEEGVRQAVASVRAALEGIGTDWEIVVVDDGSTDGTARGAGKAGARVVSLPENRGYGAALKSGIARARHDTLVMIDADGTYPAEAIPEMLALAEGYDMVVGARICSKVKVPLARRPAKWLLRRLAGYLASRRIPDLNSGLRVVDRKLVERFEHLLPSGFSFTSTLTLAALCNDYLVRYHPIDYHERLGQSKIRPFHALEFLLLLLRTVVYFNPLKVFLPAGALFLLVGLGKFIYDVFLGNLSETALMGFLGGALLWAVGLLADQIARVGLRPPRR